MEERGQDQTRRKSGTATGTSAQAHFRFKFQSVLSGPQITNYFNRTFQSNITSLPRKSASIHIFQCFSHSKLLLRASHRLDSPAGRNK